MLNVNQSLLHLDQYRFGKKFPVLLYSLNHLNHLNDYSPKTLQLKLILNHDYYYRCTTITIQLETALRYQHYFCNTELRTALITKIKGLSIQTQQNTFVLFTLLKLTSDECKTLTKVSMRKPLTTIPQRTPRAPYAKQRENRQKELCIIGGESEALGFHQKIQERRNDNKDSKENKRITIGFV